MGPRSKLRGKEWTHNYSVLKSNSFNGPRSDLRGKLNIHGIDDVIKALQWGRGANSAEISSSATASMICRTLQWGRGVTAESMAIRNGMPYRSIL